MPFAPPAETAGSNEKSSNAATALGIACTLTLRTRPSVCHAAVALGNGGLLRSQHFSIVTGLRGLVLGAERVLGFVTPQARIG